MNSNESSIGELEWDNDLFGFFKLIKSEIT